MNRPVLQKVTPYYLWSIIKQIECWLAFAMVWSYKLKRDGHISLLIHCCWQRAALGLWPIIVNIWKWLNIHVFTYSLNLINFFLTFPLNSWCTTLKTNKKQNKTVHPAGFEQVIFVYQTQRSCHLRSAMLTEEQQI